MMATESMSDYWAYRISNINDFIAMGIPSLPVVKNLEDIGEVTILLTAGNRVGIVYDKVFLPINLNGRNPYYFENYFVYLDNNDDIYLGVKK